MELKRRGNEKRRERCTYNKWKLTDYEKLQYCLWSSYRVIANFQRFVRRERERKRVFPFICGPANNSFNFFDTSRFDFRNIWEAGIHTLLPYCRGKAKLLTVRLMSVFRMPVKSFIFRNIFLKIKKVINIFLIFKNFFLKIKIIVCS